MASRNPANGRLARKSEDLPESVGERNSPVVRLKSLRGAHEVSLAQLGHAVAFVHVPVPRKSKSPNSARGKTKTMQNISERTRLAIVSCLAAFFIPQAAFAHHVTGGRVPRTATEGFLSGLAHPVIGVDHLSFVLLAGALTALSRQATWMPVVFLTCTLAGTVAHIFQFDFATAELFVAGSICLAGVFVLRRSNSRRNLLTLFALAGLVHGYAYGEAVVGATMEPMASYLLGLFVIQGVLATATLQATRLAMTRHSAIELAISRYGSAIAVGYGGVLFATTW